MYNGRSSIIAMLVQAGMNAMNQYCAPRIGLTKNKKKSAPQITVHTNGKKSVSRDLANVASDRITDTLCLLLAIRAPDLWTLGDAIHGEFRR